MTSWPILERELRVWARRRVTYWGRLAVAAGGIFVCATPLLWSGSVVVPRATGRTAFDGLVGGAFLLCCMGCLLTADAISGERREGTLGLLLLTRVKRVDLLVGKFASNGLASVLCLVALMPLLALPLLTGGVSGGEAVRKAVALLNTLFLALSLGLWTSACGLERFRTAFVSVVFLSGLVLGPAVVGVFLPWTHLGLASPVATISQAGVTYGSSAREYWVSLGLVQMMGWVFLVAARVQLGRSLDKTKAAIPGDATATGTRGVVDHSVSATVDPGEVAASSASNEPCSIQCSYCGRQNDEEAVFCGECGTELRPKPAERPGSWTVSTAPTALHWLLSLQPGLKPLLWVAAVIGCSHLTILQLLGRFIGMGFGNSLLGIFPIFGLAEATIVGGLFAWVASRFLVEARRTGELELLITTPLGAENLFLTQWETLKRLARTPVLVMVGLPLILEVFVTISGGSPPLAYWKLYYVLSVLLNTANTIVSVGAIFWLAPWFALQMVGQGRVIFWTVLLVRGLPYVAGLTWSLLYRSTITWAGAQAGRWASSLWFFGFLVPQAATLLILFLLMGAARRRLLRFAGTEPLDLHELLSRGLVHAAGFIRRARSWRAA